MLLTRSLPAGILAAIAALSITTPAQATTVALPEPNVQQSLAIASAAWPNSPCAGRFQIVWDAQLLTRSGGTISGQATGRQWIGDSWQTVDCSMSLDPAADRMCDLIVHEAGHLAGIDEHTATGVMRAAPEPFPACHPTITLTRRQSAVAQVRDLLPNSARWRVNCNARVSRCVARSPRARYARYFNVSRSGDVGEGAVWRTRR